MSGGGRVRAEVQGGEEARQRCSPARGRSQAPIVSQGGPKGQAGMHREGGSITHVFSDTPESSTQKTRAILM